MIRSMARMDLADGLSAADHSADAVSVYETELAWRRRVGAPEVAILDVQSSLANVASWAPSPRTAAAGPQC